MSHVLLEVLRTGFNYGCRLQITNDKNLLPKELVKKGLLGAHVKFLKLIGNQVSVSHTNKVFVPLTAVLGFQDYTVISEPLNSDTVFVVHKPGFVYPVGTVFTTSLFKSNGSLCFFDADDNSVLVSDYVYALSKTLTKQEKKQNIEALIKKFSPDSVKEPQEVPANSLENLVHVPPVSTITKPVYDFVKLSKDSPVHFVSKNIRQFECVHDQLDDLFTNVKGIYTDMTGRVHYTIKDCLLANQLYIDQMYLALSHDIISSELNNRT